MGKHREDSPRKIAGQKTKESLIKAAEKLINEKGFDAVQVEDITNEAGCGKGSFYTYFSKKEDIVNAITYAKFDLVRDDSNKKYSDTVSRISYFLIHSLEYIMDTGLYICQQWVKGIVNVDDYNGINKLEYDKATIKSFLEDAVACGELVGETPVNDLSNQIAIEYYGAVFCWALTNGKVNPLKEIKSFCKGMMKDSIYRYKA